MAPGGGWNATTRRELLSPGCQSCCLGSDCRLAFASTSPGVCCGSVPHIGCCPLGSSCVRCGHGWRCSRTPYMTHRSRCGVCRDDPPYECPRFGYHSAYGPQHAPYGYGHSGYGNHPGEGYYVGGAPAVQNIQWSLLPCALLLAWAVLAWSSSHTRRPSAMLLV